MGKKGQAEETTLCKFRHLLEEHELANDAHLSSIDYRMNRRPGSLAHVSDNAIDWERYMEYLKSSIRCKKTFRRMVRENYALLVLASWLYGQNSCGFHQFPPTIFPSLFFTPFSP